MSKNIFSVKFPLERNDTDVGYEKIENFKEVVEYNLKSTLLTCPGELISDPNFGVCLRKALFEMPTSSIIASLDSTIKRQIRTYLPYITLLRLQTGINEAKQRMTIRINYRISNNQVVETFDLSIDLNEI